MVTERLMETLILVQADWSRYDSMVRDLEYNYTHVIDGFPKTLAVAYSYIANHVPKPKQYKAGYGETVVFLTQDADQNKLPHIKCRRCQKMGHYASNCKATAAEEDKTNKKSTVHIGIPRTWIILDTGSTTNIFYNPALLTHIITVNETMGVNCNTGQGSTNVQKRYKVTYNETEANNFAVYKPDRIVLFRQSPEGLYYHDINNRALAKPINKKSKKVVLAGDGSIDTVSGNMRQFSTRQV
eukprot:10907127-Ditylum_brightwellii.AAC.1